MTPVAQALVRCARGMAFCVAVVGGCSGGGNGASPSATADLCHPTTGLAAPLPACSPGSPCTRVAAELGVATITTPTETPVCAAPWSRRTDTVLGFTRHACIYRPPGASSASPRPLVLWFHPGGDGTADLAGTETGLLAKAQSYNLSDDPARPGFVLAAIQGRNLRFPTVSPRDGQHHDFYFRDLGSPSANPDIAYTDALIDALSQESIVDLNRIYVIGWSNGGFFVQLYAIARHATPTPGGRRVAAAVAFAAADPFDGIRWDPFNQQPINEPAACRVATPASDVPILLVHRTADSAVACDAVQAACFDTEPGYATAPWIAAASTRGLTAVRGLLIGGLETGAGFDADAAACTNYSGGCPTGTCAIPSSHGCLALVNHLRWPDGAYNNPPTGTDRETDMLQFLASRPLP